MTASPCLHCTIIGLISDRFPEGLDTNDANAVLSALALVAGDILAHGDPDSVTKFMVIVKARAGQVAPTHLASRTAH